MRRDLVKQALGKQEVVKTAEVRVARISLISAFAVMACLGAGQGRGWAQSGSPSAPAPVGEAPAQAGPGATPAQGGAALPTLIPRATFPAVDPHNFTAASPTVETVNSFLHAQWGYDENRTWSVASIQPTQAPGVVAVRVFIAESTQPTRLAQTTLFITPDGKHAIAGEVVPFGAQPFAENRALLARAAKGPSRGGSDPQLELVEFTDLECAACKAAQGTLDQLQEQFPQAHVVVEDMPLTRSHPLAYRAAAEGYCVRQAKSDAGYFAYAQAVRANQADMTAAKLEDTLAAAAKVAGTDPAAMAACAAKPATKAAVDAVVQLGNEAGVAEVPTLFVNGRPLPMAQVPVQVLSRIVVFQGKLDGVAVQEQPPLSTLK